MKCSHCGGSVIYHPGNCLEKAVLKCMACGRPHEGEGKMESKTKKCSKCLVEKSLELFSMNRTRPDDHESRCKDCMKKKQQDYRDKKAGLPQASRKRVPTRRGVRMQKQGGPKPLPIITRATPEQIIADLRRGLAIEIIDMIQERYCI